MLEVYNEKRKLNLGNYLKDPHQETGFILINNGHGFASQSNQL